VKRSHFCEQAQIIVARETVGAQTNVESESLQPWELEVAVPKVGVGCEDNARLKISVEFPTANRNRFPSVHSNAQMIHGAVCLE